MIVHAIRKMLILAMLLVHPFPVYSFTTSLNRICHVEQSSPLHGTNNDEQMNDGEQMTAQERILREAGLWEEDDAESAKAASSSSYEQQQQEQRNRNILVAIISTFFAFTNFFWQFSHPITDVQLLASMQQNSAPITSIGTNGKPTVVDFWAPWCENCKASAPTLNKVEEEYNGKVNFVMVNADQGNPWPLIEAFGVDAIPHLALVNSEGDVITALIGPTPKSVLEADLDVLIRNSKESDTNEDLPYVMLDVFKDAPNRRRVHFDQ
mmetsp:Transcript_22090/g.33384  ORF Transcript_22090/g.33384 Transcript_22090/m.33384 type:complete len:266 (+) Transcript_22090:141-938(+)|eukprot:CAMPEP_0178922314 /NCGR_PEP_ID=MMETSP0786-20121207/16082_1 /TAXON_ID=186022 /ORGANISM="Thalassionema frauenfeldii, Strain CCMP 1798" /LENGTH=265 /DNA_ID=CAMNT_0020596659 /DNA_START=46 /DNA_END=843 /DNA_ORIENTATION=-